MFIKTTMKSSNLNQIYISTENNAGSQNYEATSSWISKLFYCWFDKFTSNTRHKTIDEVEDQIWDLDDTSKSHNIFAKFKKHFKAQPIIWRSLIRTFRKILFFTGFLRLLQTLAICVCPEILKKLINFASNANEAQWIGYAYVIGLLLVSLAITVFTNIQIHYMTVIGFRIQSCIMNLVHRKVMSSNSADNGTINNFITTDIQGFPILLPMLHMIWSGPLTVIISLVLLHRELGHAIWPGVALMTLLIIIFNYFITQKVLDIDSKQKKIKDQRLSFVNEILNAIRVIKLNSWEQYYLSSLNKIRRIEMKSLFCLELYNSLRFLLGILAPFAGCLVMFATYVYMDSRNVLTVDKAFVSLQLFNMMQYPISMISVIKSQISNVWTSLKRIQNFMEDPDAFDITYDLDSIDNKFSISMKNATFQKNSTNQIKNINFDIPKGSLVAVIGPTGCGKTTLLSTIAGFIKLHSGTVHRYEKITCVPQQPWLFQESIEKNILFGNEKDIEKYKTTIEACELEQDISMLPFGDLTYINENGVNLSGGQKQRICIARAVYSDAPIVLMDDPLSSLDVQVAKKVFKHVVSNEGIMKDRTRIVSVGNLTFLSAVDYVISFDELNEDSVKFQTKLEYFDGLDVDTTDGDNQSDLHQNNNQDCADGRIPRSGMAHPTNALELPPDPSWWHHLSIYKIYIREIGYIILLSGIIFQVTGQVSSIYSTIKLSEWADSVTLEQSQIYQFLWIDYGLFGLLQIIFFFVSCLLIVFGCLRASKLIHKKFATHLMQLPFSFFRQNSSGQTMQRFSQDVNAMDIFLPPNIREFLQNAIVLGSILIFLISKAFIFSIPSVIILFLFYQCIKTSHVLSRKIRTIENRTKTPICAHLSDSVTGRYVIRVSGAERTFQESLEMKIDNHLKNSYMFMVSQRRLAVRLEFLGMAVIFTMGMLLVWNRASAANFGLCLNYCFRIIQHLNQMNRTLNQIESNIIAVDRIEEYLQMPTQQSGIKKPSIGNIMFKDVYVKLDDSNDNFILKNLNCEIKQGMKIGVVGRTGSGKSTFVSTLLRLVEITSGQITIADQSIHAFDVYALRKMIAMVQQDTILLNGTLRTNLDPFGSYSDYDIWDVLEMVQMKTTIQQLGGLECAIRNRGENLSEGQKQLLNLARALIRKPKILIFDEISSNIDLETEKAIQTNLSVKFRESTIITITHRLNFVMNYDKIVVMKDGEILEFDTVERLRSDRETEFYKIWKAGNELTS